ncbi:MAG: hypothetical protein U9R72_15600 [Chloroflexota bacterium]|nr:hypothetical protein [Chloroflexota bacterium]
MLRTFYVDKTTDTFADVLLTYGVAALLDRLLRDNVGPRTVRVSDAGSVYVIELEEPIRDGYEDVPWFCDLPFLEAGSKKPPEDWPARVVDYDEERDRRSQYFEAREQLPSEARRPGATRDEFPELATVENLRPRPDYDILAQIYQMSGIYAYTDVLQNWFACRDCFPDLLRIALKLFATTPNDVEEAHDGWKALRKEHDLKAKDEVTPVQILNPSMGKGVNRPKADRADLLTNPKSFWLLEFFKFWGMRMAGLPRFVRGGGDRKTYVLRPRNITLETLREVYRPFNAVMWPSTPIKMDVLAALRFTDVFLEQWLAGQLEDVRFGQQPGDHVSGLAVAFYKDLGQASTVLNLAEIGVPQWMTLETPEQAHAYRALLEEHRRVVTSLGEERGDQYRLLQLYRDFLSGRVLDPFFEFSAGYAGLTMSRMERGQWAPRFTTDPLEDLIMSTEEKLTPILESPGFQNVAAAIRRSTVIPQYFKARGDKGPYDVRYGLGNDLLRRAAYPDQFVQALGEFLHDYNRETAQVHERYKGSPRVRRATVTTEDIEQVVNLIDSYGSETVANLLVAFGYAREPREREEDETQLSG